MKTKTVALIALCLAAALPVMAQSETEQTFEHGALGHGYRGFVEVGELSSEGILMPLSLSTTHGYQFNPHFFAGLGYTCGAVIGGTFSFLHADVRYDLLSQKAGSPFVSLRVATNGGQFGFRPSLGYRYRHLNLNAGYWGGAGDGYFWFTVGFDFGGRKH